MKDTHASATAEPDRLSPQQMGEQVDRIIHSKVFRNSPALQRLLQYVAAKATGGPLDQLKEYTIGVEVFDRGVDYDTKIDTVVRVEVHRLRQKLKEYYEAEGVGDPILMDIPKGHYLPSFGMRTSLASSASGAPHTTGPTSPTTEQPKLEVGRAVSEKQSHASHPHPFLSRRTAVVSVAIALFLSGLIIGARWARIGITNKSDTASLRVGSSAPKPQDLVHDFWASLLGNDAAPVVAYANPVFLMDETNDLFTLKRGASDNRGTPVDSHLARQSARSPWLVARAGPLFYEDGYSGTGDVESIFMLTRVFTQMGYQITVKRGLLVTIDDLKDHIVILLGSSFYNNAVAEFPMAGDFAFQSPDHPGVWQGLILNLNPRPDESAFYKTERDPITQVVKADYALITVQPGIAPGRYVIILGALDTSGVAGATEFATSESGLAELMRHLESLGERAEKARPPFFQAILKVDVAKGHDVLGVHLVTAHIMRPKNK